MAKARRIGEVAKLMTDAGLIVLTAFISPFRAERRMVRDMTPPGEFIEIYNRGTTAVDLSGWRFVQAIDFTIPAGTTIPPDGYLVVAGDAEWMRATYGNIPVVGDFSGHLSNHGEWLRLVDQWGNLADEVDYLPGGNWPELAAGGGSSMELKSQGTAPPMRMPMMTIGLATESWPAMVL